MVRPEITYSHTLADEAKNEESHEDKFCNGSATASADLGASEAVCKTAPDDVERTIAVAAEWISIHRDTITGPPVLVVRDKFGLNNLGAIEALRRGRALRSARAL